MDRYLMLTVVFLAALYLNTASGMLYCWVNMDHFSLSMTTMFHVLCATLQHEELFWWFLHDLPAHHPGPESTMDISWQRNILIIIQHLSVWTGTHSQYQAVWQTQMEPYSTMLKWSAVVEFPVHTMTHRRKSHVLCAQSKSWIELRITVKVVLSEFCTNIK